MNTLKAIIAWLFVAALVGFAAMNFQEVRLDLTIASLEAPLSYVIALAAVGGALAGDAIVTALRWAVKHKASGKQAP